MDNIIYAFWKRKRKILINIKIKLIIINVELHAINMLDSVQVIFIALIMLFWMKYFFYK